MAAAREHSHLTIIISISNELTMNLVLSGNLPTPIPLLPSTTYLIKETNLPNHFIVT